MEKDHGVRFSDDMYATKEEVKRAMNMSNIDSIWDKVNQYRSYYLKQTSIRNVERVPFGVVLPPKLTAQIVSLEKRLSKLLVKYSRCSFQNPSLLKDFDDAQFKILLKNMASIYHTEIGEDTINAIVEETLPNIPVEYLFLSNYYKTVKYFKTRYSGQINPSLLTLIYAKLLGKDFDPAQLESFYRQTELNEKADHVFIGRHYEAAPLDRIADMIEEMCNFLNSSPLMGIVNACIAYFCINYVKPFDDFNEEISIIFMKYILAHSDNEDIAFLLPLEELLEKERENYIKNLNLESEMKLDFTYIMNYIVQVLDDFIGREEDELDQIDQLLIYQEQRQVDGDMLKPHVENILPAETKKDIPAFSEEENLTEEIKPLEVETNSSKGHPYSVQRKVALPVLPVGLDENDAELVAQHLLELYPTMRKTQAEFYSRHCTIGKYYTISQFKDEENVAYETARTSMDNLVNLGFYKKENIRNKFVYTPVLKED